MDPVSLIRTSGMSNMLATAFYLWGDDQKECLDPRTRPCHSHLTKEIGAFHVIWRLKNSFFSTRLLAYVLRPVWPVVWNNGTW